MANLTAWRIAGVTRAASMVVEKTRNVGFLLRSTRPLESAAMLQSVQTRRPNPAVP